MSDLKVNIYFACDERDIPLAEMPKDKLKEINDIWARRLSRVVSDYYTQHPNEYASCPQI